MLRLSYNYSDKFLCAEYFNRVFDVMIFTCGDCNKNISISYTLIFYLDIILHPNYARVVLRLFYYFVC